MIYGICPLLEGVLTGGDFIREFGPGRTVGGLSADPDNMVSSGIVWENDVLAKSGELCMRNIMSGGGLYPRDYALGDFIVDLAVLSSFLDVISNGTK